MAWYSTPGQKLTIFELDPAVAMLAADPRYFTFLSEARGDVEVILGDGRRGLRSLPDGQQDLVILDAFASDAVPIHLLTKEALELYFKKLGPSGALLIHISNRHLRLETPVMAGLFELGLLASLCQSAPEDASSREEGMAAATWILASRSPEALAVWENHDSCWERNSGKLPGAAWTDDFASVLPILRWLR
jgi:hypothetical protein